MFIFCRLKDGFQSHVVNSVEDVKCIVKKWARKAGSVCFFLTGLRVYLERLEKWVQGAVASLRRKKCWKPWKTNTWKFECVNLTYCLLLTERPDTSTHEKPSGKYEIRSNRRNGTTERKRYANVSHQSFPVDWHYKRKQTGVGKAGADDTQQPNYDVRAKTLYSEQRHDNSKIGSKKCMRVLFRTGKGCHKFS